MFHIYIYTHVGRHTYIHIYIYDDDDDIFFLFICICVYTSMVTLRLVSVRSCRNHGILEVAGLRHLGFGDHGIGS